MKSTTPLLALIAVFLFGCESSSDSAPRLMLENPLPEDRTTAMVSIPMDEIKAHGFRDNSDLLPSPVMTSGEIIPHQYLDSNQDGVEDKLLLSVPIDSALELSFSESVAKETADVKTHVLIGQKSESGITPVSSAQRIDTWNNKITQAAYQFEGPGWENELVAFRNYLDRRNGIDIFGKTGPQLTLDKTGREGDNSYHELQDWGMDILKVGSSLGAGGIGLLYQDSLIRVSSADSEVKILEEGPLYSSLLLTYKGVDLGNKTVDITQIISIEAGTYSYQSSVDISDPEAIKLVVGIVDLHELDFATLQTDGFMSMYTYGLQSENKDSLGMALVVPASSNPKVIDTDDISDEVTNTYALVMDPQDATYQFFSGWELSSPDFASEDAFRAFLMRHLQQLDSPVTYSWK